MVIAPTPLPPAFDRQRMKMAAAKQIIATTTVMANTNVSIGAGRYSISSPSVLPVARFTRCTWVQARQDSESYVSPLPETSSANHACTFKPVAGHRKIRVGMERACSARQERAI
jgi:hypothetical protein